MNNLRPSSLPALSQCPCFTSQGSDFAEQGITRHAALAAALRGDLNLLELLDDEDREGTKWAYDRIMFTARTTQFPLEVEVKHEDVTLPNFQTISGTIDASCGPELWDFKWRERDYTLQVACYALFIMLRDECDTVTTHLLFGATRREHTHKWTLEEAWATIQPVIERSEGQPTPCDYCSWCSNLLTCPPIVALANTVTKGYGSLSEIDSWHPSQMVTQPEQIAVGLRVLKVLEKWCASMQFHADEAALKKGMDIPGCEIVETKGKQYVSDTLGSYQTLGMPADDFLKACEPRLNTSKTYTDKVGLIDVYKTFHGLPSTAAAKREVLKKLDAFIKRGNSTKHLRLIDEDKK